MIEDGELLRRYWAEGSQAAFTELVNRRIGFAYAVALRRTRDSGLAEDVTQKVFIALARNAEKLSSRPTLLGWLHLTAHNSAIDLNRAEARRKRREAEVLIMDKILASENENTHWEHTQPLLDTALAELEADDRDILILRYYEGKRLAEIGDRLKVSENAARMRVDRSVQRLRAKFLRAGIGGSLAALETVMGKELASLPSLPNALTSTVAQAALANSSSSVVGTLAFMTSSKTAVGVASVVAMFGLLFSGQQLIEVFHNRSIVQSQQTQTAADRAALKEADRKAAQTEAALTMSPAPASPRSKPSAAWDPLEQGQSFLRRHPEIHRQLADYRRLALRARYGGFIDQLKLSGSEIDQLENLMVTAPSLPWGPNSQLMTFDYNDPPASNADFQSKLTALLGENGVAALERYDDSVKAREAAASLVSATCYTEAPLTAEQTEQYRAVILANTIPATATQNSRIDWPSVITAASTFLEPNQLAVVTAGHHQSTGQATAQK